MDPDETPSPTVGLGTSEFAQAFADLHRQLEIELPDVLT